MGSGALRAVVTAAMLLAAPTGAEAQLADAFAGHFGGTRTRESAVDWSASLGVLLLTQYGSRWKPAPSEAITDYDQLQTTVGYNYLAGGMQRSWLTGPGGMAVVEASGSFGITSDKLTHYAQDGLHDFRRFPHVQRPAVDDGIMLYGGEVEAAYWWSWRPWVLTLDLYPTLGGGWSSYHREVSAGIGASLGLWKIRASGGLTKGWLYGQGGIDPAAVGSRLTDGYWKWEALLAFDRTKYGALTAFIPTVGAGVSGSTGIFQSESELLMSVFFEFPAFVSNDTWRVETVNDLLGDKDRGPTGGLRITYVAR